MKERSVLVLCMCSGWSIWYIRLNMFDVVCKQTCVRCLMQLHSAKCGELISCLSKVQSIIIIFTIPMH